MVSYSAWVGAAQAAPQLTTPGSSFQPVPSLGLYAASKAFVLSLSESLSEELRGTGVTVTALCPGITKTDMYERAHEEHDILQSLPGLFLSDVGDVAREG